MSSDRNALTVSYGSFSCTLEGFDDAIVAMKAITHHFRGLSVNAQARLDSTAIDVEALKTVAKQALGCDLNATRNENGIFLRPAALVLGEPSDSAPLQLQTPVKSDAMVLGGEKAPQVAPGRDPVKRLDGLRKTASGENISAKFAAKSAEVLANAAEKTQQTNAAESVAEKLSRIRSAVAHTRPDPSTDVDDELEAPPASFTSVREKKDTPPDQKPDALLLKPKDQSEDGKVADPTVETEVSKLVSEAPPPKRKPSRRGKSYLKKSGKKSVTRLVETANSQLEGSENRRRLSAIAHLKAAVAATTADQEHGGKKTKEEDELSRYRNDLTEIVHPHDDMKPNKAEGKETSMAPLMLVSSQRTTKEAPEQNDTAAPDGPAPKTAKIGFPEFAALSDADDLLGLMEVAAAYLTIHQGRNEFSRQLVMQTLFEVVSPEEVSREDGIRAFGTLLKQGKVEKAERGLFSLPASSPYKQN